MSTILIKRVFKYKPMENVIVPAKEFLKWAMYKRILFIDTTANETFWVETEEGYCSDDGNLDDTGFYKIIRNELYWGKERNSLEKQIYVHLCQPI